MVEVDEKLWPLLVMRFEGSPTQDELDELARRLEACIARQEAYVSITDARLGGGLTPAQRQQQADWLKKHDGTLRKYCLGNAVILTSSIARLTINVIHILYPMPIPHAVLPTMESAAEWAATRLETAGYSDAARLTREAYGPRVGQKRS